MAPAAAPEESPALADLGELIVNQGADNSSDDTDDVPAPAMKTTLPPGIQSALLVHCIVTAHLAHVSCCLQIHFCTCEASNSSDFIDDVPPGLQSALLRYCLVR